jgi:ABC-type multidrug transport system fused ATPase/permease subunit
LFDALEAISILSVFLAAGARVAPAILRMQQGAIQIRSNMAVATQTLELWTKLNASFQPREILDSRTTFNENFFTPGVMLKNVSFRYPDSDEFTLKDIDLEIRPGDFIAIAGSSGAGKSTLVDLILGVLEPNSGQVLVSGRPVREIVREFPGKISCVPQQIAIFNSSIADNVGLGSSSSSQDHAQIWQALETAELSKFVRKLPGQLDYVVSDQGANLSGGQVQRLGIARAIVTNPSIIVMDEATSALDGQTETAITNAVTKLSKKMTVIIVAHRLSTIRNVERVIYLDSGQIIADGTIAEVRKLVPSFDDQCNKMGI